METPVSRTPAVLSEQSSTEEIVYFHQPFPPSILLHPSFDLELVETQEVSEVHRRAVVVEEVHVAKQALRRSAVVQTSLQHTELQVESTGEPLSPQLS